MRVAIAGAGNVGRSIAGELLGNGHEVLLIEREARALKVETVPGAEWLLAAVVEEAVSVGDLVRLLTFRQGQANLVELTLAADAPIVGKLVGAVPWPTDVALTAILREGRVIVPAPDIALEGGDELLLVATTEVEGELDRLLSGS
jgi:Trk K+ transport system NAD-binding subunit